MESTTEMMHGARGVRTTFHPNKRWLNPAWRSSNRDGEMLSPRRRRSSAFSKPYQKTVASLPSRAMLNNLRKLNVTKQSRSFKVTMSPLPSPEMRRDFQRGQVDCYPRTALSECTTTSTTSPTLTEGRALSTDHSLHGGTLRPLTHQPTPDWNSRS